MRPFVIALTWLFFLKNALANGARFMYLRVL